MSRSTTRANVVVDTNVLIYAADADSEFHEACRSFIERSRSQAAPWFLTWGMCYEYLRVAAIPLLLTWHQNTYGI